MQYCIPDLPSSTILYRMWHMGYYTVLLVLVYLEGILWVYNLRLRDDGVSRSLVKKTINEKDFLSLVP